VQSIDCLLSTLKPPFTLPRAGRFGLDSKLALLE
jgi:hypothetical protein